jgi:hypothetical protein
MRGKRRRKGRYWYGRAERGGAAPYVTADAGEQQKDRIG